MKKYSASRIDVANYCVMRYYLKYIQHEKPLRLSVYVKGGVLHKAIEQFWLRLGSEEEVKRKYKTKKSYFDRDSFADFVAGKWMQYVIADEKAKEKIASGVDEKTEKRLKGRLIYWRDEQEKWTVRNSLKDISKYLFDYLIKEGPPIYSELPFDFISCGKRFTGSIDEVRLRKGKVVIRDYKSGVPWIGQMKVNHDPQMTIYNIGLCSLSYDSDEFARILGLQDRRLEYMGNPIYIDENFELNFL